MAAALLFAARLLRNASLAATAATVGTWNLCLGALAAVFALGTGLAGVIGLDVGAAARHAISVHMRWAMFTTLALVLLAVWRGAGTAQESRPSWLFIAVLLAASAALAFTGYRGGKNVYEYGVGVKKIAARSRDAARRSDRTTCTYGAGISREVRHHIRLQGSRRTGEFRTPRPVRRLSRLLVNDASPLAVVMSIGLTVKTPSVQIDLVHQGRDTRASC